MILLMMIESKGGCVMETVIGMIVVTGLCGLTALLVRWQAKKKK